MEKRKYLGVPTQNEIIDQFNLVKEAVKDVATYEQILELMKKLDVEVEINSESLDDYHGEEIEVIRYEYKNLLVYSDIENGTVAVSDYITLYDDNGVQFADEKYDDYEQEFDRMFKLGAIELA